MRSHALVYLAPALFLVACEPMPPPAAQPREVDARTLACTAAHLVVHTAAATPETFAVSRAYRTTMHPMTTPTAAGVPAATAAPISDEELKSAILHCTTSSSR